MQPVRNGTKQITELMMYPVAALWIIAGPLTYILSVAHTWQTDSSVFTKIFVSIFLDAAVAALWPGAWIYWLFAHFIAQVDTPLALLLGRP